MKLYRYFNILSFLCTQKLKDFPGRYQTSSSMQKLMGKVLWMVSISRNSIVVVISMILAYILDSNGYKLFKLTGMKAKNFITPVFYCSPNI
jgi:hemolysin-activating ACP:hemolysin acyltransferase